MSNTYKLLLIILASHQFVISQTDQLIFDHLSVDDGLSNNIVLEIFQDSRGFMWIGTEDGLNKYDGYKFTVYRHDPEDSSSITGNFVRQLHESDHGGKRVLWVGTHSGLNRLDLETEEFTHFKNDPNDSLSMSNNYIISIFEDSFDELWIGTHGGINKLNRKTNKFTRHMHDPSNPNSLSANLESRIYETVTDGDTVLWFGTWKGLNKFDRKTKKFTHYKHSPDNPNSLSNNNITDFFCSDSSGILWIATEHGGLNKFNLKTEQFTRFEYDPLSSLCISSKMVRTIIEDNFLGKKVLWVATYNGLNLFDLKTERFTCYKSNPDDPQSLSDNHLVKMFKDKTGSIWIGTHGGGINKFDPNGRSFTHFKQETGNSSGLSDNKIFPIIESEYYGPNVFWIGTMNGGLNRYNRNTGKFVHYRHDPDNPNSLCSDIVLTLLESNFKGRNELWIGTEAGLDKFDLRTETFTHYQRDPNDPHSINSNIVRSICEDKTGTLWIGTRVGGINRYDRNLERFHQRKYNTGEALSIIEDHNSILWAGTFRGLFQYNPATGQGKDYKPDTDDPSSLSHRQVLSIYEDKSNRLWVGTQDGLNLLDRETNTFTHYKVKDGLPSNVIHAILEDNTGNLWLSTNYGLSKFDPEQKTFRNYDTFDGLQSNQFMDGAACLSSKGEMLFGGINGFNVFHPDSISDNPHIPSVYLTDFQIFNKSVGVENSKLVHGNNNYYLAKHISNLSEITLSYKESVFSFDFAALDYHSPLKNKYAYKMEGVDPDWVYTDASRRFATYTQLDPGEYFFRVLGSNNDGLWNEEGASLKITIRPPWWKTTWAYSGYLVLIVLALYGLRSNDKKRQRLKHELEMEQLHAEKLEEVDQMKSRFFTNISHEFRTPLTLIKGPIKQLMTGEFKGNLSEQYRMILRNSDRLLGLINQILDLSKLESGQMKLQVSQTDLMQLLKGLVLSFFSLAERKKIALKFESTEKSLYGYVDRDKIEKIITNLLSNAFKFTPEGGKIIVDCGLRTADINIERKSEIRNPKSKILQIKVTNTGPAIPKDQLEKIFDRYYQTDTTYKNDSEGSGIGLALTKELVELHNGTIHVRCNASKEHPPISPLNRGELSCTTFTIFLPIGKEHFKDDEIIERLETEDDVSESGDWRLETRKKIPPDRIQNYETKYMISEKNIATTKLKHTLSVPPPDSGLRPPLVLIVEDNPDVTTYIRSFLDQEYIIINAINGKEGWQKAVGKYPELIISDVMMPEMDGFELCQKIKSDERISHIPVILLTAKADLDSRIEGLEFGADDYISKPFEADELKVRAKNLIEQRQKLREKFSKLIEIKTGEVTASSMDEQFLDRLLTVFEEHISESDYSTENFAKEIGMSRNHLNRKLKALTDLSTHQFLLNLRLKRAAQLLRMKAATVSEVAYTVGFNSPSKFARAFKILYGSTPSNFSAKEKD